jgi:uncharacterized protein (UPF0332 family)
MSDNQRALIQYRLQQANEALEEAVILRDANHLRGALGRAYYGMFHAVQALIVQRQAEVSKHSGTIAFFDREYVKTGIFDKQLSKWLHRMFDLRQDSDYGDMFAPSQQQCDESIFHAREFVDKIKSLVDSQSHA